MSNALGGHGGSADVSSAGSNIAPSPAGPATSGPTATRKPSAEGTREPAPAGSVVPKVSDPPLPKSAKERVAAARSLAAKHGAKLMHPVEPKNVPSAMSEAAANAKVTVVGSAKSGTTMRIVTARGDLTGQRELASVAGDVIPVGPVSCSQRFKFANEEKPAVRKNLLVCWRTAAQRSVVVLTADVHGKPSRHDTVETVNKQWSKLG
ncbi:hypothetical protein [Actinoplanes sp. URMC 104]|uniref:hypothetical protein n=1 Tax=Actinoplanes sp. URMC 104 TaxID=3423409 RepID=UPI003F1D24BD